MRSRVEGALRVLALAAILGWIALALRPREDTQVAGVAALVDALPRWTRGGVDRVHVHLDTVPDERRLAWLEALRGAGVAVTHNGAAIAPLGVEAFASPAPAGGAVVLSASSGGVLSDALGAI